LIPIDDVVVNEEDGTAVLKICVDEASDDFISVEYTTNNGSAIDGEDYEAQTGVAVIMPGELCAMVMIDILDDENPESTEELTVTLSDPINGEIVDGEGTVTILDSDVDELPTLVINDVIVNEEDGTATLTVTL